MIGRGVLDDRQVLRDIWLLPLRDFVALAVWFASYWGNTVVWRGLRFKLRKGKLEPSLADEREAYGAIPLRAFSCARRITKTP